MATRIVLNAGTHTRARTKQILFAAALLCGTAGAHASVLCINGNTSSSGSYDTLYTGNDVLVYPGTAATPLATGTSAMSLGASGSGNPGNTLSYGTRTGFGSAGWTQMPQSTDPVGTLGSATGGTYGSPVVSYAQTAAGASSANPCASGGANSGNTVATINDITTAISGLPTTSSDSTAVHYDTDAGGNKTNSVTLTGGTAGPVAIHNVAAGTVSSDAATVGQLNNAVSNSVTQSESYTDQATKYFKANSTGAAASATGTDAVAIGPNSVSAGTSAIALGNGATASGTESISIGTGNKVTGNNSGAIGDPSTVTGSNSYVLGNNNTVANNNAFVVGNNVTTTQDNSVVLGNASTDRAATTVSGTTINGTSYTFAGAGSAAKGVVSVGSVGGERQVINVAAGNLSATSTDAVNGSQLYATNQAVTQLGNATSALGQSTAGALGGGSTYNPNTGAVSAPAYVINNVTYNDVGSAIGAIPIAANNSSNLPAPTATGANSVAIGPGSTATRDNSVSVGSPGNDRTITNVAPGTAPNDAATVGQINQAGRAANAYTDQQIGVMGKRLNALGATSMSTAALQPNARAEGNFQLSAGVGTYGGATALAIGAHWWVSDRVLVNAHVSRSMSAGGSTGAGLGTTIGF